jgi:hypothetical protein
MCGCGCGSQAASGDNKFKFISKFLITLPVSNGRCSLSDSVADERGLSDSVACEHVLSIGVADKRRQALVVQSTG